MRTFVLENNPFQDIFNLSDDALYFTSGSGLFGSLYLTNSQTGVTQLIATGTPSNAGDFSDIHSFSIDADFLSQDGRFVVYTTADEHQANIFSAPTTTWSINIFDRTTGVSQVVYSDTDDGTGTNQGQIDDVVLSPDGQSVFFSTDFPNLTGYAVNADSNVHEGVFELNLQTHAVQAVLPGTVNAINQAIDLTLSPGGKYLVAALVGGTQLVNIATGNVDLVLPGEFAPSVSADGRFAVFDTSQTFQSLVPQDTNGVSDVYLADLTTGAITLISQTAAGVVGNGFSATPQISADGSEVLFETAASNISPGAVNGAPHLVLWERGTGYLNDITTIVDNVEEADNYRLSADGHTIALSTAKSLSSADTNTTGDIYLIHISRPLLTIDAVNGDGYVNRADSDFVTISGTSDAYNQTIDITAAGKHLSAVVQSNGTWSTSIFTVGLADGAYTVHTLVSDGLTATADRGFTVDRTPPQLTFTSVAGDDIVNLAESPHALIAGSLLSTDPAGPGTLPAAITISIDGEPRQPLLTTSISSSPAAQDFSKAIDISGLADGEHTITLTATDEAGNTTTVSKDVLVDKTPPKISITSVSGDDVVSSSELNTEQGVHGTSDEIGATVDVLIDGVEAGQAVVQADGSWLTTISFAGTVTGTHDVSAKVVDEAGNPGRADAGVYVDTGFAVTQLSAGATGAQGGGQGVLFPELSADGTKLVFTGLNFDLLSTATGSDGAQVYIKDLATGAISFAMPDPGQNAEFGAISPDGRYLEFVTDENIDPNNQNYAPGLYFTFTEDLTTGTIYPHVFSDDGNDQTDPDTFEPGIGAVYFNIGGYPDKTPIAKLPVFPLAIANGGDALELVDHLEGAQVVQPIVMTTEIREDLKFPNADGTSYFSSGDYLGPDASPPIENSFNAFIEQEYAPQLSADGSVVAFEALFFPEQIDASDQSTVGPPTLPQIYAGPLVPTGGANPLSFALASSFADGTPMPFGAIDPALSADGRFVAFWSWDNGDKPQVYVKNLTTGELKVASSDALGNPGVNNASGAFHAGFNSIAISADGRYVAFTSDAKLTADDTNTNADLFVKDMQTGAIQRVPLPAGTFASDLSAQLTMTANGQYIAFTTTAGLAAMDTNHVADVYGISLASLGAPPPQITIGTVAGDDRINASEMSKHLTVSGTSDAIGQTVTLYVDGGFLPGVVVGADGIWSTTIDTTGLIDGVHQLRASVTGTDGATATDGDLVTVDTVPPVLTSLDFVPGVPGIPLVELGAFFSEGIGQVSPDLFVVQDSHFHVTVPPGFPVPGNDRFIQESLTSDDPARFHTFTVEVDPNTAFDFAGNGNAVGGSLTVGAAFDGYIVGGTVSYANGSGNGATATTDANGNFVLSGGNGPLVMTGGTDSSTGLTFTGTFKAPDGSSVLSPLTTLVEKLIEAHPSDSVAQANDAVAVALGLPAGIDLTVLDAVGGTLAGDAASLAAFKAGSELLDIVTLIEAAGGSADAAYAALATDAANGTPVDLTDAPTIQAIAESSGLDATAAHDIASIVSQTDAALEQQLAGATSPLDIFIDITGASIALQGDAATGLSHANGDDGLIDKVKDGYLQDLGSILSQADATAADNVACYCAGTLIATDRGDVVVEDLRIGDRVRTRSGLRPIKWIGTRSYGGRFIMGRKDMLPICFKAGSLGDGLPRRDLWISPHHAMYLDGVLIEAKDLVNGASIVQVDEVERVDYFHIELDSHDVILAEGAWSETFVDDDSRDMFHNAHEFAALYGDELRRPARYCAPRLEDGFEVEAIRRRLAYFAGMLPFPADIGRTGVSVAA